VSVEIGVRHTLAAYRVAEVEPYVGFEGDDGIEETVRWSTEPLFGRVVGERLTYQPYDDGDPSEIVVLQADGVRLTWTTSRGEAPAGLDAVVDSVAVE
jgi:hypothetical protein